MKRPFKNRRPVGPFAHLGVPRAFHGEEWPFRPPTEEEVRQIRQYHIEELGFDERTAKRHVDEEFLVILDEFVPDDTDSYRGKIGFALADHVRDWAIYYWPGGEVDILASSGSTL